MEASSHVAVSPNDSISTYSVYSYVHSLLRSLNEQNKHRIHKSETIINVDVFKYSGMSATLERFRTSILLIIFFVAYSGFDSKLAVCTFYS